MKGSFYDKRTVVNEGKVSEKCKSSGYNTRSIYSDEIK